MQHIQHKRLAKRLVPRFEPTWLGQQADPTTANAEPTSTVAVLPPVATTENPVQTPTVVTPAVPTVTTPVVQITTTSSTPTPVVVPTVTQATEQSTSSQLTTSSALTTSTTSSTTSTTATPTAVQTTQTTAAQQTTTRATNTAAQAAATSPTRTALTVTNAQGQTITSYFTASASATPTETAQPTSSNAGTIVGAVAGGLVGVVCLIAFVSWLIRQHNKRKNGNHDDFDRQSYLRNSIMLPDEPGAGRPVIGTQAALALARNNTAAPRPPTMIERKPTYLMHNGQPSPSFHPGQVVSFEPGQVVPAPPTGDGAYPSPMAFAAYTPPAQHHQSELSRRPSGAQLLTRQPTNGGMYDAHTPSPIGYGPDPYRRPSPESYQQDGYTYPMHPGTPDRAMIQSVTPFQAQQYAEITRALEGPDFGNDSFHPISPAYSTVGPAQPASSSPDEKAMANPFEEHAPSQRIDSTPPSLPVIETLSRTGTPIDPNPQHAHWSYDGKAQVEGSRLSVAGMPAPVIEPPAMPAPAYTREDRTVVVGNGEELKNKRPVSYVDTDDAYGGM